jgi:hypothetical protein
MIQGTKCKLSLSDSDAPGMFDEITHLDVVWGEMPASLINTVRLHGRVRRLHGV